ncbi:hypothetical protein E3N88_01433 [Mikania micrantha]|uniref:Uncharacterized protein n=1 Tax=Mikania micrantha TaxID=192012 RepID=A0A5N6Q2F1_9ASTR|nr:hypothetical protein E3N88_01433 [Mikania micrantha]
MTSFAGQHPYSATHFRSTSFAGGCSFATAIRPPTHSPVYTFIRHPAITFGHNHNRKPSFVSPAIRYLHNMGWPGGTPDPECPRQAMRAGHKRGALSDFFRAFEDLGLEEASLELDTTTSLAFPVKPSESRDLRGCSHQHLRGFEAIEAVILDTSHPRGHLPQVGIWGMANNDSTGRNADRHPTTDDMAAESRRRVHDIVSQVDAEMGRRARDAARARYWGWLPTILQSWIVEERVPPYRYPGDTTPGHRLPPFGVPMEQAFAAHVACTRREVWRGRELTDEMETLRLQVSQLMTQHGQIVDVMQEHDARITENRTDITETQAMVQASDAMLNAWAAQFIEEPPQDDGPEFEAEDLEDEDLDEDPNEDPEEDDDDGDAASDISHKISMAGRGPHARPPRRTLDAAVIKMMVDRRVNKILAEHEAHRLASETSGSNNGTNPRLT